MKLLKHLSLLLLVLLAGLSVASCKESDTPDGPDTPAARQAQGSFIGMMHCTIMGQEFDIPNVTIRIAAVDDTNATLTISSFGITDVIVQGVNMHLPELEVRDVTITGENSDYAVAQPGYKGVASTGKAYTVTLRGTQQKHSLNLDLNIKYGSMPMPIVAKYTGLKLQ